MKTTTLTSFILAIIIAFLLQGANLIHQIHDINVEIQSKDGFSKANMDSLYCQLHQFEHFLYLFASLIAAILCSLFLSKKEKKSKRQIINDLQKIKKRANIEKNAI